MPLSKSDFFENLSLRGYMCDSDLVLMLRAMTNAKELRLYGQSFGQRSYAALMNEHSNTITILYISECTGVSSTMIQGMLSGCPSLVCFEAGCIQGADLVRVVQSDFQSTHGTDDQEVVILGEDWSCLKLYHLSLYFNLSGFEAGIDRSTPNGKALFRRQLELEQFHAFRQLSRLHSLRYLNVDRKRNDDGHMPLNLRLRSHGGQLDQLKTLKNLRTFHPPIATLDLSDEEKKWVQDSWGPHFR
ncbi:hypothetical protein BGZ76_001865 [Entomortierella beljakovae]|nr:hypothetical protein BGZ76_001865 [Entomortierella beljakovae]